MEAGRTCRETRSPPAELSSRRAVSKRKAVTAALREILPTRADYGSNFFHGYFAEAGTQREEIVTRLVAFGLDLNALNHAHETPLHVVCRQKAHSYVGAYTRGPRAAEAMLLNSICPHAWTYCSSSGQIFAYKMNGETLRS